MQWLGRAKAGNDVRVWRAWDREPPWHSSDPPSSPEGFSPAPLPLLMGLSIGSGEGDGLRKSFHPTLPAGWSYSGATKYGPKASSENRAPAAGLSP